MRQHLDLNICGRTMYYRKSLLDSVTSPAGGIKNGRQHLDLNIGGRTRYYRKSAWSIKNGRQHLDINICGRTRYYNKNLLDNVTSPAWSIKNGRQHLDLNICGRTRYYRKSLLDSVTSPAWCIKNGRRQHLDLECSTALRVNMWLSQQHNALCVLVLGESFQNLLVCSVNNCLKN